MSFRSKATVLAVATLSAVALAACGPNSAAETGDPAPDSQSVMKLLVSDAKGSLQKVVDSATKAQSVKMKMDGTVANETFKGDGVLLYGGNPKAEFTVESEGTKTTVRLIGSVFYVSIPEADRAEMDGKSWMKMDLSAAGEAGDSVTQQLDDIDPVKQVKTLLAAGDKVTVVGEETIDGVKTVHYTVTSPVADYLGQLDGDAKASTEKELAKAGVKEVKMDLWVDDKYQPRRVHAVMGKASDMTVDYTDYGTSATIEEPPAAEVLDFAEMLKGLKG